VVEFVNVERMSDEAVLIERLRGRTLRDLADTTGLSIEGVRVVVAREGRKQIDKIELALLAATKTNEVVAFVMPDHSGPDFDLALEYVRWVVAERTERGVRVRIHYRPTENGVVLALEDITRPRRARS
jgi:hypothetical protein